MARKQRIHIPGGVYHVMLRGNGGQKIFFTDDDRYYFELLVEEGVNRFGHRIHGYCWMSNHVHMAIQVEEEPLSKIIQNLSFRYTRYINKKKNRMGHLFQGRYKAILVDSQSYLPELIRYIHLNPVRANLVSDLRQYPWSGHAAYMKQSEKPWLTRDWVLSLFAKREIIAIKRYEKFVLEGIGQVDEVNFQKGHEGGRILGDDSFIDSVLSCNNEAATKNITVNKLVEKVCQHYGQQESEVLSPSRKRDCVFIRNVISYLWVQECRQTLKEWADYCGKDLSTLSRNLTGFRNSLSEDGETREKLLQIIQ